jgi:hypothetical protein
MGFRWAAVLAPALILCCTTAETDSDDGGDGAGGTAAVGGMGGFGGAAGGMGGTPQPMCDFLDYTDSALFAAAPVSFADDVVPIFQNDCTGNGSSCHSTSDPTPSAGLALAPPATLTPTPSQLDDTYAALVDADSGRSSLPFVSPGDPAGSFLLIKLEYDTPSLCMPETATCSPSCGRRMPAGAGALPIAAADKQILRTWIRDGASRD